jgi:hypothetical protein
MKNTTPPKDAAITMSGKLPKMGTGHRPHLTGGGTHKHKCDRRQGTRAQRTARAIDSY